MVVPSTATANDVVAAGIERSRVHVVLHGVRAEPVPAGAVAAFAARHGLARPYVLWDGHPPTAQEPAPPRRRIRRRRTCWR